MRRTIGITNRGLMWDFSRRLEVTIPDRASTEPTDRSMPPEMMTKVIPTARISRYALSMKRLRKFCSAKKPGERNGSHAEHDDEQSQGDENGKVPEAGQGFPFHVVCSLSDEHLRYLEPELRRLQQADGPHDQCLDDRGNVGRDAERVDGGGQGLDDEGADDAAQEIELAAVQGGSAEHDGQDGVQLEQASCVVAVSVHDGGAHDKPRNSRAQPAERVHPEDDVLGVDSGEPGRRRVDSHRLDEHPRGGPPGKDMRHEQDECDDVHVERETQDVALSQDGEWFCVQPDLHGVREDHGDPAAGHEKDQGGNDGLHADPGDQHPVPHSRSAAYQQCREHGHDDGVLRMACQVSANENGHRSGGNGHHGAHRDVDSVRGNHERHADGQQHDGCAIFQDIDQVAVQVSFTDLNVQEVRREDHVEKQESREGNEGPGDVAAAQGLPPGHVNSPPRWSA